MAEPLLPTEIAVRVVRWFRKLHLVIREGFMLGGVADLDHFESIRRFEHAMPDERWLQHAIARLHHERWPLVFVEDANPSLVNVDHLEANLVEVHVVRDQTGVRNLDVRSDEGAAEPIRDEVAVAQAGATRVPEGVVVVPTQDERRFRGWYDERWIGVDELDAGPVRRRELGGTVGDLSGVVAQKAKHAWGAVASARPARDARRIPRSPLPTDRQRGESSRGESLAGR